VIKAGEFYFNSGKDSSEKAMPSLEIVALYFAIAILQA
jgi:hypothetical protein